MAQQNILFVDDNTNIINGIKRMLRRERDKWGLYYVQSGAEALKLMEHTQIDLIVTDMLMPTMPGEELLKQVAKLHPSTVRIILSGYADTEALKSAMSISHQYLSKPCSPELLKETISQVFKIQTCIYNPLIISSVGDIQQLPSLPLIYQNLQQEIYNKNSTSHSIAEIFTHDIALSAKLLQLVNSPYFGLNRQISNLTEAVNLIGLTQLSSLILSTFVNESFPVIDQNHQIYLEHMSSFALCAAKLAKKISLAEKQSEDRPDQAYLGALLQHIGLLIFMSKLPDKFDALIIEAKQSDTPIIELEQQIFGFTSPEVGAYVLGLWKIPPRITESILLKSHPSETDYNGVSALTAVHAAAALLSPYFNLEENRLFSVPLDTNYLERINRLEQVPYWEQLAQEVMESSSV